MTAMKRVMFIMLFLACLPFGMKGAGMPQSQTRTILKMDTVTRTDTIITRDVIRRTDVITRLEEVIRTDTIVKRDGKEFVKQGVENLPTALPEMAERIGVVTDTVNIIQHDTVYIASTNVESDSLFPEREGGKYIWVPDSMSGNVDRLLAGTLNFNHEEVYDDKERVTFRGDTIPMMLRDRNFGRFDRGLFNYLFIPKGIWQFGITASYGEFSTSDLEVFSLLSDIDLSGRIFSIRPYFSYFINNNMSVGMRIAYTSGRANIDSFQVDIDDDMNFNLKDIMYRSEQYTASLLFNQYFGIARRGRFGVFNEVELAFSSGNSDFQRPYNGELKTTHTTTMQAALNFSPGVAVFIMENVSFNVSFGVFGFTLRNERQKVDGEDMGNRFTSGANFRFNIFNINFGIAVNI